jgi:hypothetical protein
MQGVWRIKELRRDQIEIVMNAFNGGGGVS